MAICQKCGFVFVGLGHDNSPMQNIHTGQWSGAPSKPTINQPQVRSQKTSSLYMGC